MVEFPLGEGGREGKGGLKGITVRVNVRMSSGGCCSMHMYVPACCLRNTGMSREPLPRSWRPESVAAGARGTGADWKNQVTTGAGRPEAIQSN